MSNRIREYLEIVASDKPDPTTDVIINVLDAYDICRQNRNQLTHFRLIHNKEENKFILSRQKGPTTERVPFPDTLLDLRRVGDELWGLSMQLALICRFIQKVGSATPEPLPKKVLLPELLWKPAPPTAEAQQPQRPPSVLKLTEEEWIAKYRKEGRPLPERE